jgi:hypothetical protein
MNVHKYVNSIENFTMWPPPFHHPSSAGFKQIPVPIPSVPPLAMASQQADAINGPVNLKGPVDLVHFFTGFNSTGRSSSGNLPPLKVCKLCLYVLTFSSIMLSYEKQ